MKKTFLIALFAALTFCACSTDSMNTYWRNNKTGEWVIGITENNVVYDSKVWDITSKSEADDAYTIEARCGQKTISVNLGKENSDKRIIIVNGTETECSLIDDQYLPDYPEKDTTPLANNNYAEGDSVTIMRGLKVRYMRELKAFIIKRRLHTTHLLTRWAASPSVFRWRTQHSFIFIMGTGMLGWWQNLTRHTS